MMVDFELPRGIRNNNPGNIRLSGVKWKGQKLRQVDTAFIEFDAPVMGLRALMRLLLNYHLRYGLDSVESILNRYAPPEENATDHYIHSVCREIGVKRREALNLKDPGTLIKLAKAIVRHENGPKDWYGDELYTAAAYATGKEIQ
jgi:hypothetical protein